MIIVSSEVYISSEVVVIFTTGSDGYGGVVEAIF